MHFIVNYSRSFCPPPRANILAGFTLSLSLSQRVLLLRALSILFISGWQQVIGSKILEAEGQEQKNRSWR